MAALFYIIPCFSNLEKFAFCSMNEWVNVESFAQHYVKIHLSMWNSFVANMKTTCKLKWECSCRYLHDVCRLCYINARALMTWSYRSYFWKATLNVTNIVMLVHWVIYVHTLVHTNWLFCDNGGSTSVWVIMYIITCNTLGGWHRINEENTAKWTPRVFPRGWSNNVQLYILCLMI